MSANPDPARGAARTVPTALIDESRCIGCTLCIEACPFDAIVGRRQAHAYGGRFAVRRMRAVCAALPGRLHLDGRLPARAGLDEAQAVAAGARVKAHKRRLERESLEREARLASRTREDEEPAVEDLSDAGRGPIDRIAAIVARAVQRARQRRSGTP